MVINRKVTGRAVSMPAGIAIGIGVSLGMTLAGALLLGLLIDREAVGMNSVGYGSMIILLVSSILGALVSKSLIKHRSLLVCMVSGAGYFLSLLAMTALFFGGQYHGVGVTLALVLAGAGTAVLLSTKRKNSITKGYRKMRTV